MPRHELDKSPVVNLNNASLEDLAGVPGIGRERAEALLMYREQNGPLANWGELRQVRLRGSGRGGVRPPSGRAIVGA